MSQYIQQHCRRGALLLIALVCALPASARNIIDVSGDLFLTRDETPGIQLPRAENGFSNISDLYTAGPFFGSRQCFISYSVHVSLPASLCRTVQRD